MKYLVVTNNPLVKEEFEDCLLVEGSFLDVLIKVRDLIHNGMKLASHPLGASVRMLFSPYRSIVVQKGEEEIKDYYVEIIENSIISYKKHMNMRNVDEGNSYSYALMDKELLYSTFKNLGISSISEFV
ncbi:GrdX family protein [Clostridium sp. Cult2]|uniref:GrdX family protein n=1 Tax=Clostridium sp. Cult2 TaxID=2079003 RepID=UPI001F287FE7|nr:GrdX family protein [Clostridium sp. Cult2]MCF6466056.1 hypothetical protein [Clostridium sp. Cult2]